MSAGAAASTAQEEPPSHAAPTHPCKTTEKSRKKTPVFTHFPTADDKTDEHTAAADETWQPRAETIPLEQEFFGGGDLLTRRQT